MQIPRYSEFATRGPDVIAIGPRICGQCMSVGQLPTVCLERVSRVGGYSQGPHDLAIAVLYCFRVRQVHRQFDRLTYPLRKIDELKELSVLAPIITVSAIFDLATFLLPISHRREFLPRRRTALPEIEKHWLARLCPQTRRWWYRTIRVADILAVSDKIVVLFNDRTRFFVAVGKRDFMVNGIGAEVDEPADL